MVKHFEAANRQLINKVRSIVAQQPSNTRYQNYLIVFLLFLSFSLTFKKQSIEYFFLNPFFHCQFSSKIVAEDDACRHLHLCTLKNQHTLTAQMGLYCDSRKHERTFIQSLRGIGGWTATILVGAVADAFGRKICMVISLVSLNLSFVSLIAGAITHSVSFFMISEFLEGIGNKFIFAISLVYMTRFLRKRMYESITNVWYIVGGGCSHLLLALVNHYLQNWFLITLISFVPLLVLLLVCPYFIKEDPIYLFEEGKHEQFSKEVIWIGQFNGKSPQDIAADLQKVQRIKEERQSLLKEIHQTKTCRDIMALFCLNKGLFIHAVVLGVIHLTCDFTLSGITYSLHTFGFTYNINIAIMGSAQILGSLFMIKMLGIEEDRKRGFIVSSTVAFLITLLLLFPFIESSKLLTILIVFCARFLLSCVYSFGVRVEIDSFPEKLQISLMSIIEVFSASHGIIAPSLIQFGVDHHLNNIVFLHTIRFVMGTCPMLLINASRHELNHEEVGQNEKGLQVQPVKLEKLIREQIKEQ